jgi:methylated-DNA-[protein]-cysteine S-methyltransferase
LIELAKCQLQSYFSHQLRKFEIPLHLRITDFQRRVLEEVARIPFGQTITYMQLAHRLGSDRLTRAVAGANASNPFLILLPCHRVVGRNNAMTGYAGEVWRKKWLLDHEKAIPALFK